jgi:CRP-like cAMP-binding protein
VAKEAEALKRICGSLGLSEAQSLELARIGDYVRYKAGDVIMREGEASDTMYLFLEGTVDVSKELTLKIAGKGFGQAEKSMTRLAAGSAPAFGEMSIFGDEARSATVSAVNNCLLFSLTRAAYDGLCARDAALALALTRSIAAMLSSRVRKGNEDVLKLTTALSIALSR